jgi:hypothetical protein
MEEIIQKFILRGLTRQQAMEAINFAANSSEVSVEGLLNEMDAGANERASSGIARDALQAQAQRRAQAPTATPLSDLQSIGAPLLSGDYAGLPVNPNNQGLPANTNYQGFPVDSNFAGDTYIDNQDQYANQLNQREFGSPNIWEEDDYFKNLNVRF